MRYQVAYQHCARPSSTNTIRVDADGTDEAIGKADALIDTKIWAFVKVEKIT